VKGFEMKTDQEINHALALAIGYLPEHVEAESGRVWVPLTDRHGTFPCQFDYKDWHTIGPIAAKYDCFPYKYLDTDLWVTPLYEGDPCTDTPQKAIALAVIQGATTARTLS
jgi:hypothetical protein